MSTRTGSGFSTLRKISLASLWLGFALSLYFMFITGRENKSFILIALFTGWVSSPYLVLFWLGKKTKQATLPAARRVVQLRLVLPVLSLLAYSGVLLPVGTRPAFIFLVWPFLSWLFLAGMWLAIRKHLRTQNGSPKIN